MASQKSKTVTPKCQATHPETNELVCDRSIWNGDEKRCIFHSSEKPTDTFKEHFLAELKRVNETDSIDYFDGRCFIFPQNIKLEELSFEKRVMFDCAKFEDNISFEAAKFGDEASFWHAQFGNGANFREAQFGDDASFWNAQFGDNASFRKAQFGNRAIFGEAQFGNEADFLGAQFGNEAYFREVKFSNKAYFRNSKFSSKASFGEAQFGNEADFLGAQFGNEASFTKAQFGDKTFFAGVKFGDQTSFGGAQFGNEASFLGARLGDEVSFVTAKFGHKASFVDVKFDYRLNFSYTRFSGEMILEEINNEDARLDGTINFTNVTFEKPNQVRIRNVDLRSFALVRSNVQDADFLDCKWPTIGKRPVIFDEIHYSNHDDNKSHDFLQRATLGEIEQLYRRLQLNFENNKRYAEAGNFYIGAMEMRRKQIAEKSNKTWRWLRQSVLSLEAWYRNVSLYGERLAKTLIWMVLVIFLFPTFYLLAGFKYSETNSANGQYNQINYDLGGTMNRSQIIEDYLKALVVSVNVFTFQRNVPFRLTVPSQLVSIAESALSATLLALFLLALRRRFKR